MRGPPRQPLGPGARTRRWKLGARSQGRQCPQRLPKSTQPAARKALAEIRETEDRDHALAAIKVFQREYRAKWPKAVAKVVNDTEMLLSLFEYPAEHWVHLKTSNSIRSTFATVRLLRTKVTKGPGSKAVGLTMAYKPIEAGQDRWRSV